jgi:hypothetical protein
VVRRNFGQWVGDGAVSEQKTLHLGGRVAPLEDDQGVVAEVAVMALLVVHSPAFLVHSSAS